MTQYLSFQIFAGPMSPASGIFTRGLSKAQLTSIVQTILSTIGTGNANQVLAFCVGPIPMDLGAAAAQSLIADAFDVAVSTGVALAFHLDDFMFWRNARWSDGSLLIGDSETIEWCDWQGTPSAIQQIDFIGPVPLAPQLCYEAPRVMQFNTYWMTQVIGPAIVSQLGRLAAGQFAGVIAGWESNMTDGYHSLEHLGFSAANPPADFENGRETVLQRQIARCCGGLQATGIPNTSIYSHIAPQPKAAYQSLINSFSRTELRKRPMTTDLRAYWTAFNSSCRGGFSCYYDADRFADVYAAVAAAGATNWAMSEGTNTVADGSASPYSWESYLARSFNHGATLVNLYGGFQGLGGPYQAATESAQAVTAYKKFLAGTPLVE